MFAKHLSQIVEEDQLMAEKKLQDAENKSRAAYKQLEEAQAISH